MNFFPDFATNSRKQWRVSLFQSNLRKQIRNLPKILNFVKKIHYYSELFTSLLTQTAKSCSKRCMSRRTGSAAKSKVDASKSSTSGPDAASSPTLSASRASAKSTDSQSVPSAHLGVKWIIQNNSEFFHKIQNFRQISDLFSQIWLKKRHTSLFSGIWREIRKKIHQKFAEKNAIFEVFAIELLNIHQFNRKFFGDFWRKNWD